MLPALDERSSFRVLGSQAHRLLDQLQGGRRLARPVVHQGEQHVTARIFWIQLHRSVQVFAGGLIFKAKKVQITETKPGVRVVEALDHLAKRPRRLTHLARVEELHPESRPHSGKKPLHMLAIVVRRRLLERRLEGLNRREVLLRFVVTGATLPQLVERFDDATVKRREENQT